MSLTSITFKPFILLFALLCTSLHSKHFEILFKEIPEKPCSSIKGIDGIYVINLDVRPEKWHRIEPILYYHSVDYVRFPAIFGLDFDISTIKVFCAKYLRMGGLGCMLSHLSIYDHALKKGLKVIWVLEDDAVILRNPKVLTKLIRELNELDPEWDILYTDLDYTNPKGTFTFNLAFPKDKKKPFPYPLEDYTRRENLTDNIQIIRSRYATTSMIVSARGMAKVLKHFTTDDDILWPIDIEIHYVPGIRQYGIIHPVATNGNFSFNNSDTGLVNTGKLKDYYEVDDDHVKYLEERMTMFEDIQEKWPLFFPLPTIEKPKSQLPLK